LGEVLASASAIVCDDLSSVILYAAALNKRIILVPSGSNQIPADSFATRLAEIVPNLTKPEQFRDTLAKVLNEPPPRALRELAGVINSCPGQAAELIITEVYRLLKLPRPNE
jgi:CDP-glycerol glycerophosphotransferase (TagB/SpsB family)